jgi:hypothetical protein
MTVDMSRYGMAPTWKLLLRKVKATHTSQLDDLGSIFKRCDISDSSLQHRV